MRSPPVQTPERKDWESFDSVTEDEIMFHWRLINNRLPDEDAWQAIVTGIALDMAFEKVKARQQIEH